MYIVERDTGNIGIVFLLYIPFLLTDENKEIAE